MFLWARRMGRASVVVVDESGGFGRPPAHEPRRPALVVDEPPVLAVLHCFLQNRGMTRLLSSSTINQAHDWDKQCMLHSTQKTPGSRATDPVADLSLT